MENFTKEIEVEYGMKVQEEKTKFCELLYLTASKYRFYYNDVGYGGSTTMRSTDIKPWHTIILRSRDPAMN